MSSYIAGTAGRGGHFIASTTAPWGPAVGIIMKVCSCTRQQAFFAYFNLLAFIHENGHGCKAHATRALIDQRADLPGFADALVRLGWLAFDKPNGTPMHWGWKLRKAHAPKRLLAKLENGKGGAA